MRLKCLLPQLLENNALTQQKVADRLHLSQSTVSLIVNGHRAPTLRHALKIARLLGVPVESIWRIK